MYFPYLRGKQFELETLLDAPAHVYRNTLPILEPIGTARPKAYERFVVQSIPIIFIMNPFYPAGIALDMSKTQAILDNELRDHPSLEVGFIVDARFLISDLNMFLRANPAKNKALIFRNNPNPPDLISIQKAVAAHGVEYVVFDEKKTDSDTKAIFASHPKRILITDGFQRQESNINYPKSSRFTSNYASYTANGWAGIGDYLTLGDHFQAGGGPVYVVSLHITKLSLHGIMAHHFSSTSNQKIKGLGPKKFAEANHYLVTSPETVPLTSVGIAIYRDWHTRSFNPHLGAAKKASMIHHIELMSGVV